MSKRMSKAAAAGVPSIRDRYDAIPDALKIRILYSDDDLVIVSKPPGLRSVPGNAVAGKKRPRSELSPQQQWVAAIESFLDTETVDPVNLCIQRLGQPRSALAAVPRRRTLFERYFGRNLKRVWSSDDSPPPSASDVYDRVASRLPDRGGTTEEESALGQLQLLGYDRTLPVHRLDCDTSGLLVVARAPDAASSLGKAWRERASVTKVYWARVREWLVGEEGRIEVSMAPTGQGIRWGVVEDDSGKPSTTEWKVLDRGDTTLLELRPITGRTHQLRVHCAHVGYPIVGDSIYGSGGKRLMLHAYHLSIPHPTLGQSEYTDDPGWRSSES